MIHVSIGEIVRIIGLPAAEKLVERFGGSRVYLPHPSRVKLETPAAQVLGIEAACRLACQWPQCEIAVPGSATLRRERDHAIRAEPASATVREIARKYGLTERRIQQIRAKAHAPDPTGSGVCAWLINRAVAAVSAVRKRISRWDPLRR